MGRRRDFRNLGRGDREPHGVKSAGPAVRFPLAAESAVESVRAGIARLARVAADDVAALPDRSDERVHDIRVGMKKIRALLRLASPAIPRRKFLRLDRLACEIKDAFGVARDRGVQLDLLARLLGDRDAAAATLDSTAPCANPPPDPAAIRAVSERLAELANGLDLDRLTSRQVAAAWIDSYRRARRAMEVCKKCEPPGARASCPHSEEAGGTPALSEADSSADFAEAHDPCADDLHFHAWRKKVKRLLYQSVVLGPPTDRMASGLDGLSHELGAQHDLAVLCANLSAGGRTSTGAAEGIPHRDVSSYTGGTPVPRVEAAAGTLALALAEKLDASGRALGLGRDIFRLKPKAHIRKLVESGEP